MKNNKLKVAFFSSLAVFALSLVGAMLILFGIEERIDTVDIPDYVGKRLCEVRESSFVTIESKGVYSDAPEGEIISQTPYAGAERKLKRGEKFRVEVLVSLGEKRDAVPDLRGYHYAEAAAILRGMGASVRTVAIFDENAARETVIRTSPDIGAMIREGERVTLFVATARTKAEASVGSYVGLTKEDAIAKLLMDGLGIGSIIPERSAQSNNGVVLKQSIKEGALVPYGTEIDLTVGEEDKYHPFGRYPE